MDRLQKRKWLLDNIDLLLTEATYHREHEEAEQLPGVVIWRADEEGTSGGSTPTDPE